ncbi:ribosome biogenesis GTPase Der [Veillonella magna]|uniref:ribosome biogenesis GTPase Der n=1 Tax=Veillonella magna TaxID=464322 RepID=UPI002587E5D1|nr:ribosome biogenesis GTPase Der [Veillonella magna]
MAKPLVAVVGRPNVGKSTLFNAIVNKRISIVEDIPGVTRDRIYFDAEWLNKEFTMIDTGGIEFVTAGSHVIPKMMRLQAQLAIEEADVILFVVDGKTGIVPADEEVANILRSSGKPVILVVNKIDSQAQEANIYEFYNLGIGDPIGISAKNLMNLGDLLDDVVKNFPDAGTTESEEDTIHVALIGRPNVGKSSLTNALLGQERVIVSDVAGTTRDSIDTHWTHGDQKFVLIDTAGMRRKAKIDAPVERYSIVRSLRSVDRADVVVLVLDATDGVTEQDKKIAGYAHEAGKGMIIVVNKWDLIEKDDKTTNKFTEDIYDEMGFLQYAPILFASALTKQRIHRLADMIKFVSEQQHMRISTSVLNQVLSDAQSVNPVPSRNGRVPKIYYMTQASVKPPTFILFVNEPELIHFSYMRFLENRLRESFGFEGTPIRLILRGKKGNDDE